MTLRIRMSSDMVVSLPWWNALQRFTQPSFHHSIIPLFHNSNTPPPSPHPQLLPRLIRHHRRIPRRLPDEPHVGLVDAGDFKNPLAHHVGDTASHAAALG